MEPKFHADWPKNRRERGLCTLRAHSEWSARAQSRFRSSISLFLSLSWHCLQVSLWIFCIWTLEQQLTSYTSVHARGIQCVKQARAHSRFRGSISLFLSHFWHCLHVSLWNLCNGRSYWWPTGPCTLHVVIDARARTDGVEGWFFQHFIRIQFSWRSAERINKMGPTVSD